MPENKIDYKKALKHLYQPGKEPEVVEVPEMQFITIEGNGAPECADFSDAIEALYQTSYTIKFSCKKNLGKDYSVMPLEGLWWADNIDDFVLGDREQWRWILMIMQPDFVSHTMFQESLASVSKKNSKKALGKLDLVTIKEGKAVQMMHTGPFADEHPNIMKLHDTIHALSGFFDGKIHKHHEIYLSDFRKTNPAKLKTILRQPFVTTT